VTASDVIRHSQGAVQEIVRGVAVASGPDGLRALGASAVDTAPQMVLSKSTRIIVEMTRGWMNGILEMNQDGEIRILLLFF